jgi:metal-dependent hydrolase (beta-lactamase superfamily II)
MAICSLTLDRAATCWRTKGRVPDLYLNHCTGEHALSALANAFGESVSPCPAGTALMFD